MELFPLAAWLVVEGGAGTFGVADDGMTIKASGVGGCEAVASKAKPDAAAMAGRSERSEARDLAGP